MSRLKFSEFGYDEHLYDVCKEISDRLKNEDIEFKAECYVYIPGELGVPVSLELDDLKQYNPKHRRYRRHIVYVQFRIKGVHYL